MMVRKDLYFKGFDYTLFEEHDIMLGDYAAFLLLSKVTQFGYIDECLSRYRFHSGGIANNPAKRERVVQDTHNIHRLAALGVL